LKAPLDRIRAIQVPLIIAGIVLSTLHQSSLGSVLLMMPDKIHPLWFSPFLPVLFFISAVTAGVAMTLFEASFGARALGHAVDVEILRGLGKALVRLLALYLAVRLGDLIIEGKLALIFTSGLYSLMFLLELGVGLILPLILFALPAVRNSRKALSWSTLPVLAGLILHRFNVSLIALAPRTGTSYFPHLLEFVISISIVAAGILAYLMAGRYLPVIPESAHAEPSNLKSAGWRNILPGQ
jgi:Ni/Fe-hydrogenase subunit HybB-like protein